MEKEVLINVRVSEDLKREFSELCKELGVGMSGFLTICIKKSLRVNGFPFDVSL